MTVVSGMADGNGTQPPGSDFEVLDALGNLPPEMGLPPLSAFDLATMGGALPLDGSPPEEEGTYEDQPQPGSSEAEEVPLSEEERQELARELQEYLSIYRPAMAGVHERWTEIEDAYHLKAPGDSYRTSTGEQLVSPLLMMLVDQAAARLEGGILEADPLVRIRPVEGVGESQVQKTSDSGSAENFYNNYLKTDVELPKRLKGALRRCPKLGTAVLRWDWKDETRRLRYYAMGGTLQEDLRRISKLAFDMIPNEETFVWPLDISDWQDAEIVGHRAYYSKPAWRRKAADLGLSVEEADEIGRRVGQMPPPEARAQEERQGVDPQALDAQYPPVALTELWCHRVLPGYDEPERFVVLMLEDEPRILRITWNTHHQAIHPYFPLRYKVIDGWAWGHGIGHEVVGNQQIASALKTLRLENIAAGAFWVNLVKMGSLAHTLTDSISPGEKIPVERVAGPEADFATVRLGGEATEIGSSESANDYEARSAVGLPDVLQGMADRTMKSGSSTGQTLALIEQASVKFNSTGRTVQHDLGDFLRAGFGFLCQYAPNGLITRYADERDSLVVQSLRWTPPRGLSIAEAFQVWVEAPSMATSNESRKERGLVLVQFLSQQMQLLQPLVLQILQQENPAATPRYLRSVHDFFAELDRRIIRYHDLPGLEQVFPVLPEEMPQDQLLNQLQQQLQEIQGIAEQLGQENEFLKQNIAQGLHHEHPGGEVPS